MANINTNTKTSIAANIKPVVSKTTTANTKATPAASKTPTPSAKSPATVVSLNQAKNTDLGLYDKTGVTKTTAASNTTTNNSTSGFVASGGDVVVDVKSSDSGYQNKIYWSTDNFKTKNYIGVDNNQASVNIGSFAKGTKVEFGIENDAGQFFRTGDASANIDQQVHAKVTTANNATEIGFEDLFGGGDNDFNDAIISVRSLDSNNSKSATPVATPITTSTTKTTPNIETKTPVKAEPKTTVNPIATNPTQPVTTKADAKPSTTAKTTQTNRSGLGDGTNPGQGAGTAKSPNQGTNNPSKTAAYTSKAVTSQFKIAV